jgi:hypothetical protein
MRLSAAAMGSLLLLAACESSPKPDESDTNDKPKVEEICDGSEELRFAAYTVSQGNSLDSVAALQGVGWAYIYVSGQCHYWVIDDFIFRESREGDLTTEQARALAEDFSYSAWSGIEGDWGDGSGHGAWMVVHDTKVGVACYFECPGAPAAVQAVANRDLFENWVDQLYAEGTPLDGPIRMSFEAWGWEGTIRGSDFARRAAPWPLQEQPSELAPWIHEGTVDLPGPVENPTGGHLITEAGALLGLRAARTEKGTYDSPPWLALGPAEGGYASIQLRDSLPFEDDEGHVPEPSFEHRN